MVYALSLTEEPLIDPFTKVEELGSGFVRESSWCFREVAITLDDRSTRRRFWLLLLAKPPTHLAKLALNGVTNAAHELLFRPILY